MCIYCKTVLQVGSAYWRLGVSIAFWKISPRTWLFWLSQRLLSLNSNSLVLELQQRRWQSPHYVLLSHSFCFLFSKCLPQPILNNNYFSVWCATHENRMSSFHAGNRKGLLYSSSHTCVRIFTWRYILSAHFENNTNKASAIVVSFWAPIRTIEWLGCRYIKAKNGIALEGIKENVTCTPPGRCVVRGWVCSRAV